jgi:hypothetical protein
MAISIDFVARKPRNSKGQLPSFARNKFLFPLFYFSKQLNERGVRIHFWDRCAEFSPSSQVLCLEARAFITESGGVDTSNLEFISGCRNEYDWIVWFDNRDSSGTTQLEVLPYVDRYAKKAFLKEHDLYRSKFYGDRYYFDYIHKKYNVEDTVNEKITPLKNPEQISKFRLSWNLAYFDYRSRTRLERFLNFALGYRPPRFINKENRTNELQARYTTEYDSEIVSFFRKKYLEMADRLSKDFRVTMGRISRNKYKRELQNTMSVLSPFGWGEICFRDFEAMQYGCALIKPSVEHLETWPDLFVEGETYIKIPWDFDESEKKLRDIMKNHTLLKRIGIQSQEKFKKIWSEQGASDFVNHFVNIVKPAGRFC